MSWASRSASSERHDLRAQSSDRQAQSVAIGELWASQSASWASRSASSKRRRWASMAMVRELSIVVELQWRRFKSWALPLSFIGDGGSFINNDGFFSFGFFWSSLVFFFFFFWPKCLGGNVLWIAGLKCFVDSWEFFSSLILPYSDKRIFLTNTIHNNTYSDEIFRH